MLVVIALATLAYWLAGWSLGDAFYMVIFTVYTVGYGEVHPIDTPVAARHHDRDDRARLHRHDLPHRRAGAVHHAQST